MFAPVGTIHAVKLGFFPTFNTYMALKVLSVAVSTTAHFTAMNHAVQFSPRL
jgi:hypothetical protein